MKLSLKQGDIVNSSLFFILGIGIASTSTILNHNPYGPEYAFFYNLWPGLVAIMVMSYFIIDLHAQYHAYLIEVKNKKPNHLESWVLRALIAGAMVCILHAYYFKVEKISWLLSFSTFWFLLVFNPKLNYYRSKMNVYRDFKFFYIAEKDNGSWVDAIFNNSKYGGQILYFLSVLGALFCAYKYIL